MIGIIKYNKEGRELWRNYIYADNSHNLVQLNNAIDFDDENNIFISATFKTIVEARRMHKNIIKTFKLNANNNSTEHSLILRVSI